MILVTGSAGFIGSNFTKYFLSQLDEEVLSYDKLTYSGNLANLDELKNESLHSFLEGDISDSKKLQNILFDIKPRAIINFAAETHVDKSIDYPEIFFQTNVMGTLSLLYSSLKYWEKLNSKEKRNFRFVHVSTDEVYGSLGLSEEPFKEEDPLNPNNPYSASKASSDHLVRSFFKTYDLPVITSNCSNNYGPFQYPEKIIPLTILNFMSHKKVPVYGNGEQIRDWLYVKDHCKALMLILNDGVLGETYNVGGKNQTKNIEVVELICDLFEKLGIDKKRTYKKLINYVKDRPGHDLRYAINISKISKELDWEPEESFESGLMKTVSWYLENKVWVKKILNSDYKEWIEKQYS